MRSTAHVARETFDAIQGPSSGRETAIGCGYGQEQGAAVSAIPLATPNTAWRAFAERMVPATPRWLAARSHRVWLLTFTIALLSLTDLFITLTYLRSIGMPEGNPIARMIMSYNSPALLITWKLATIAVTSMIFILGRHRRIAEIGCWLCVCVLGWLTFRWIDYTHEVTKATPLIHVLAAGECGTWVKMEPEGQP